MTSKNMGSIVHVLVNNMRKFIAKFLPEKSEVFDGIVTKRWLEESKASKTSSVNSKKFTENVFFDSMIGIIIPDISSVIAVDDESDATASGSESSVTTPIRKFLKCGILLTKEEKETELDAAVLDLNTIIYSKTKEPATLANIEEEEKSVQDNSFGKIIKMLEQIECLKVPYFIQNTKAIFGSGKPAKVVVAFNYNVSIVEYFKSIKEQKIIPIDKIRIITGSTTRKARTEAFDSFQSDDPNSVRLIIANMKVISLGVSLDDQTGNFPRYALSSPSYMAIDQHQFIRRFFRKNTKSVASVFFIYSHKRNPNTGELIEQRLLQNITAKSDIIKKISCAAGDDTTKTKYMSDFEIIDGIF